MPINDFFYVVNNNKEGSYSDIKLEDAEIQAKTVNDNDLISYTVVSYWAGVIMYDILGFKYHASNYLLDNNENPVAQKIVDIEHCEGARYGKYYYKMFYKIPGIDKIVFTGEYEVGPTN